MATHSITTSNEAACANTGAGKIGSAQRKGTSTQSREAPIGTDVSSAKHLNHDGAAAAKRLRGFVKAWLENVPNVNVDVGARLESATRCVNCF